MMRESNLCPIEQYRKERETSKSSSTKANWDSGDSKSQKLKGTFRGCITQKVKSRVQATRLQHLKYVEGTSNGTRETTSS